MPGIPALWRKHPARRGRVTSDEISRQSPGIPLRALGVQTSLQTNASRALGVRTAVRTSNRARSPSCLNLWIAQVMRLA